MTDTAHMHPIKSGNLAGEQHLEETRTFTADELKEYSKIVAKAERESIAASFDCKNDCLGRKDLARGDKCTWSYDGACNKALAESIRNFNGPRFPNILFK